MGYRKLKLISIIFAAVVLIALAGALISNSIRERDSESKYLPGERDEYFSQGITTICGSPENKTTWIYRLNESGVFVREADISTGKIFSREVNIVQITDIHFNYVNKQDMDEANPSVMSTYVNRTLYRNSASVASAVKAMEYAGFFDQTVITGDTLDYLSWGTMELTQKYIWDVDPEALIALGNHDITRVMEGTVDDPSTLFSRLTILKNFWKHNPLYTSKVVKDKVMVIQLDNGRETYWDFQADMLAEDIKTARDKGYIILIFQHTPISTGNPADEKNMAIRANENVFYNFYSKGIGDYSTGASKKVYDLITTNADVIRGIFCGHRHSDFYMEIIASYTDKKGVTVNTIIPQYLLTANVYDNHAGHVLKINVK